MFNDRYKFKFKIWDDYNKRFVSGLKLIELDSDGNIYFPKILHRSNNYVFVQCTGLRDMNNKFIYDQDILEIDGEIAVVDWIDDGWKLIGANFLGDNIFPQIRSVCGDTALWGKVIGNVFENYDLLSF